MRLGPRTYLDRPARVIVHIDLEADLGHIAPLLDTRFPAAVAVRTEAHAALDGIHDAPQSVVAPTVALVLLIVRPRVLERTDGEVRVRDEDVVVGGHGGFGLMRGCESDLNRVVEGVSERQPERILQSARVVP